MSEFIASWCRQGLLDRTSLPRDCTRGQHPYKRPLASSVFLPKSPLMAPRPAPPNTSPSTLPATMYASNRSPLSNFLKQFQVLMTLKDSLAGLDDPTSDPFKIALCNFLTALVRFRLLTPCVADLSLFRTILRQPSTSCHACLRQAGTHRLAKSLAG